MVARTRTSTGAHTNTNTNTNNSGNKSTKGRLLTSNSTISTTTSATSKSQVTADRSGKHVQALPLDLDSRPRFSEYPKIDQAIMVMKSSLSRFTRANDRRMVLRTLKEVKYLRALSIDSRPPPMVDLEELEMEVAKESLVLNGQTFHRKTKFGRTSSDFLHVLHELCFALCENASGGRSLTHGASVHTSGQSVISSLANTLSPDTLYYDVMFRLARTISSADCFAKLNDILGSNELILMNSNAERKPKIKKDKAASILPNEMGNIPPIEVTLFEEGGNVHAHIVTTLGYGLYRKLDVNTGRPWIKLQAELIERINFSSGSQVRHVTVHWPDMYV